MGRDENLTAAPRIGRKFLGEAAEQLRVELILGFFDAEQRMGDLRAAFLYASIAQYIAPSDAARRSVNTLRIQLDNDVKNDARRPMVNDSLDQDRLVRPKVGVE